MRKTFRSLGLASLLFALASMIFLADPRLSFAQKQPVQGKVPLPGSEDDGPKPEGFLQFTFPEDRDSREQLRAVMDYLEKTNIPWDVVTSTAQRLLDSRSDSFFNSRDAKTGKENGGRISVKSKINDLLGKLPKEGKQVYELNYGPTAENLLKQAIQSGYDKVLLSEVSQRYFYSKSGLQAAIILASLDLESGNYSEAAYGFQRLLNRMDVDEFITPRLLFKAAMAFKRSGDPRQQDQVSTLITRLEKRIPREGLVIGRKTYSLDELKQELDRPFKLSAMSGDGLVTTRYGNNARTGRGIAGTPFLEPSFSSPVNYRQDDRGAYDWVNQQLEQSFKRLDASKKQTALPGFFPITTKNFIVYRTYDGVYAVAARDGVVHDGVTKRAGEICWAAFDVYGSIYSQINRAGDFSSGTQQTKNVWLNYWQNQMPGLFFENAMLGSLSHDGVNVYCVNDLAVPPAYNQYNPNMPVPQPVPGSGGSSNLGKEYNQLSAIRLNQGDEIWQLGVPDGGLTTTPNIPPIPPLTDQEEEKSTDAFRLTVGAVFLGPPLCVNGKLYVLYERKGLLKLMCLDPHRLVPKTIPGHVGTVPELVWIQNLGSPQTRVGQDSLRRLQPCYLSYSDGVLICPTNSGAVVAVDVNARSLLWARYYGNPSPVATEDGSVRPGGGLVRGGFRPAVQPNPGLANLWDRWKASAPIIVGNRVVHTSYDSDTIQCYNLRTGEVFWSAKRDKDDLYVAGVMENKVVIVGRESVKAYDLLGGENNRAAIAWQSLRIGTPSGHGAAGQDGLYYLPMVGNPDQRDNKDPQVWAIDVNTGLVKSKTSFRKKSTTGSISENNVRSDPRTALGNLLFHEGQLISQSATDLSAFPLIELKREEMTRRLQANPNDPEGLFDRGELSLDNGDIKQAIADFKNAQKNNPNDLLQRKLREKLYLAYTELLRNDFNSSEPFLNEYEALCEVPIDTEDPSQKLRLMDEQIRRRGLYLMILAKGRESQGKLLEAFKAYRAFANLGENKHLVEIYDEPNTRMRPDVWARGRIDSMIRNVKDPALQKPLADMVAKEWESVRTSNDLAQMREFVKVFGPYFQSGRDAQLLLGERLMATNNDEDLLEAQTLLMRLWATTEERILAAKAIEALARVMTRRGMMEDAVGLYGQLGQKYGDVLIRDGKTGSDIFGDLITDKRLLPYLEPSRGPSSSKYKVEMQVGPANRNPPPNSFALKPEGELLPFFKRYHLNIETNPNDGTVMLRLNDKVTGELRCKFNGLAQLQTNGNQGPPPYRMAQASGHLLLVTIGQWAYCFDLAEKRELWRYNLLGESSVASNPNRIEMSSEGEMSFFYEDGWVLRLGRSSVIQPNYATLLTRDGLVAIDPITKEKLWVRTNVSSKAQVFGDANYIFLVEGNTSRVFRAVDGVQVQNVPDFAAIVNSPNRLTILGRQVLLSEGNTNEPRTLRLYDVFTGQDIWKKSYPSKSVTLKTIDPELTGFLMPTGEFELLASRTGEVLSKAKLDEAYKEQHLKMEGSGRSLVNAPLALLDSERVYLFLNRDQNGPGVGQVQNFGGRRGISYNSMPIRSTPVNGVAYAFDRATGKRLWFTERLFEPQTLFLERFEELPVIVAAGQVQEDNTFAYRVITIDKQTGMLKYNKGHQQNGFFQSVQVDPKTRAVEFWRYDMRLRILPEDAVNMPASSATP